MKRESPRPFLRNHAGCDRKGLTSAELAASGLLPDLNVPAASLRETWDDLPKDDDESGRQGWSPLSARLPAPLSRRSNFSFATV